MSPPPRSLLLAALVVAGCFGQRYSDDTDVDSAPTPDDSAASDDTGPVPDPQNVILIIADDLGVDALSAYDDLYPLDVDEYPPTPTIDALCGEGVRFTKAWSAPTCSPTRATIHTGRYGLRTGIGWAITSDITDTVGVALDQPSLPALLGEAGVQTAMIGKWHLGTTPELGGADAPNTVGWGHYSGNLIGEVESYTAWEKTVDGVTTATTAYATTENIDDTIAWIAEQDPSRPWMVWLAFNAPHIPFHEPPEELHDYDALTGEQVDVDNNPGPYYRAMVQAMDTEMGRLQGWLDTQGIEADVIFIGDNGTPGEVAPYSPDKAKGSMFQGGLHVPFCVDGPSVVDGGRDVDALVHTVDLFSTVLDLTGAPLPDVELDGYSFAGHLRDPTAEPQRLWVYSEAFPTGEQGFTGQAMRNERYKYTNVNARESFYDLEVDPLEEANLLGGTLSGDEQAIYEALQDEVAALQALGGG